MTITIQYGEHSSAEYKFSALRTEPEIPQYLHDAAYLISKNKEPGFELGTIPEEDKATFSELAWGGVRGVYLLDTLGAEYSTLFIEPSCTCELAHILALDRPGPLLSGVQLTDFIDKKRGIKPISFKHPKLRPILNESCGTILYRKQVIEIARDLACYTEEALLDLETTLESCQPGGIRGHRHQFIDGAVSNWVDRSTAESLFRNVEYFSSYDFFDEWHVADHALLAYQSAYMKFNYPEEYNTALNNHGLTTSFYYRTGGHNVVDKPLDPLVDRLMNARLSVENYPKKIKDYWSQFWKAGH